MEVEEVEEIYLVRAIIDERKLPGKATEYLVVWEKHPGEDSWEPLANIKGRADGALEKFKRKSDATKPSKKRKKHGS